MTHDLAVELLRRMKRIRIVEEAIADRYEEWRMRCPTHLCIGQEAVGAAVGMALRTDDYAVGTHRSHGHYLGKGGSLEKMLAEIHGKATGCSAGKGGSMHLIDREVGFMGSTAIVGGTIPVGVGLALAARLRGTDQVSCVFFGDGSVEEGVFYESINFAVLKKLPVLFICENNLYSVYSPLHVRQPPGRNITDMAAAMGIPSRAGDGNDGREVYAMAAEAIASLRAGGGPRLFEFATYRWREHCGPNFDNDIGYRSEEEFQGWKKRDPVGLLERGLKEQRLLTSADIRKMENTLTAEVERAFAFALGSPFPRPEEAFTDLYSSPGEAS